MPLVKENLTWASACSFTFVYAFTVTYVIFINVLDIKAVWPLYSWISYVDVPFIIISTFVRIEEKKIDFVPTKLNENLNICSNVKH